MCVDGRHRRLVVAFLVMYKASATGGAVALPLVCIPLCGRRRREGVRAFGYRLLKYVLEMFV